MVSRKTKAVVASMLKQAGVTLNGNQPWDIQVHDDRFYVAALKGSLAFGEAYMAGWWSANAIDETVTKLLDAKLDKKVKDNWQTLLTAIKVRVFNQQSKTRAKIVGELHYDVGNELYSRMLDKRLVYTCAYWEKAKTLDAAQEAKLDLVCKKIGLKKGMTVLDIGCGWGSFAIYAAKKYGAKVVGVTISKEQAKYARELAKGLPVEIRLQDYRDVKETFDRVISLGMFEHVGWKNYRTYMEVAHRCLKDDGIFLLHTIGGSETSTQTDPWIEKYIFPNSIIPSMKQITHAYEGLFVLEDWHNFGLDYDRTLCAWHANFTKHWDEIQDKYSPTFKRMWDYYLLACAGSFRARKNHLWQIVLTKEHRKVRYSRVS